VPSESALAQPPSSFSYRLFAVSLSLLNFSIARLRRRSSFSHGRPSGNVRGSNANALDPPSLSRASPLAREERDASGTPLNPLLHSRENLTFSIFNIFAILNFFNKSLPLLFCDVLIKNLLNIKSYCIIRKNIIF